MTHRWPLAAAALCTALWLTELPAAQPLDAAQLATRVAQLRAEVGAAEDLAAIKRLQRTYGYFVDKGLWTDLAEYFTDNAVANYPAGTFIGKDSIRKHLYRNVGNVGNVALGEVGLEENRLYNHMNVQPVVHIDPAGNTAQGRWRAVAMFGSVGGGATWAEGIYQMQYRKEGGVWKISKLDYYSGFGASYATGWAAPAPAPPAAAASTAASNAATAGATAGAPAPRPRRQLAHPADRERDAACDGFPAACLAPFTYNPVTPQGSQVWQVAATPAAAASRGTTEAQLAELARRAQRLQDEVQIENLQRIYGYYYDRAQWDQMADLFADNGTIEFAQQGVFAGKKRVRQFLGSLGPQGLVPGWLNDRIQLQIVVTVSADGRSARARGREFSMTGHHGRGGEWSEGIYENAFVNEGGKWKFASVHFFPTFQTDYDQGWGKQARPAAAVDPALPPDRPPTQVYAIFPKPHVPPFHYRNPVTGSVITYPSVQRGGPEPALATRALFDARSVAAARLQGSAAVVLQAAERDVARYKDYHAIENLESSYGYYLDKNLWDPLADLFAANGSIELAMRGVYRGSRVRGMLWNVFGRGGQGPVAGRLGNHLQLQPVIHVAPDGNTAKVRLRMLQQMSQGTRASIGASMYENEFVKEDGVWKFSKVNTYNTLSAGYEGGWARAAGRGMPGQSTDYPPDAPPSRTVVMFPLIFQAPYHYANPVSGRTALPAMPTIEEQLRLFPIPPAAAAPGAVRPATRE
jgi:SnoaL-like domain